MKNFFANYFRKVRECAISASPILAIIILTQLFLGEWMQPANQINFGISVILLIFGQALFLISVDGSILTMGEQIGSNIRKLKKLPIILLFGVLFGTLATIAEPAVSVLSGQVANISGFNSFILTLFVSVGIGILVAYALLRIFLGFSLKISFLIMYAITFVLISQTPDSFRAIAFDFSGATTGAITVPFILALGVGVTAVLSRKDKDDSYGLIGLASIGPIITVCIMAIIFRPDNNIVYESAGTPTPEILATTGGSFLNILLALSPIAVIFFIFNAVFIKLPKSKLRQILTALVLVIVGLGFFVTGVNLGLQPAGDFIGRALADPNKADYIKFLIIPLGFVLGFAIAYAEPALKVLGNQIEDNTQGKIKKSVLILTLAVAIAITVMLGMIRILCRIDILWFLIPIIALGFILMPWTPKLFVGIAFDSGGVATGTITAAFSGAFALGVCETLGLIGTELMTFSFGMVAFICVIPIPAISLLGLTYNIKLKKLKRQVPKVITSAAGTRGLQIFGIICKSKLEAEINMMLTELNAKVTTTLNATGSSRTPTAALDTMTPDEKIFILGMIDRINAAKMIEILECDFNFTDPHSGIAWTIPIEGIKI